MNRRSSPTRRPKFRPEGLETRGLLSVGASAGLSVVEDLGEVSKASAIRGVEVTAPISSGGSVTFRFEPEVAGDYTLKVRYTGEGLALEAQGPSGKSAITPGPAGPFATVHLSLESASYAITATALGDQPAFVDWELLLNNGVGQGVAPAPAPVNPSAAIPLPPPSALVASSLSPSPSTSTSTMPAASASAISFSMVVVGGPLGRAEPVQPIAPVGPTTPDGSLAMAYAGDGMPAGIVSSPVRVASGTPVSDPVASPSSAPRALELLGDGRRDEEALAVPSWFGQLAGLQGSPMPGPDPAGFEVGLEALAMGSDQGRMAGLSPGLIAGAAVAVALARGWRPRLDVLPGRRGGKSPALPLSIG